MECSFVKEFDNRYGKGYNMIGNLPFYRLTDIQFEGFEEGPFVTVCCSCCAIHN